MPETTASTPANAPTSGKPVKRILIQNGTLTGLYDDKIAPKLHKKLGGAAEITRASHVEAPLGKLDNIEFEVDLTPSGGPKIGAESFNCPRQSSTNQAS